MARHELFHAQHLVEARLPFLASTRPGLERGLRVAVAGVGMEARRALLLPQLLRTYRRPHAGFSIDRVVALLDRGGRLVGSSSSS